jgi:hypothetical protein
VGLRNLEFAIKSIYRRMVTMYWKSKAKTMQDPIPSALSSQDCDFGGLPNASYCQVSLIVAAVAQVAGTV